MGQHCPFKFTSFPSKWENTVPQWAFKLNSDPPTAENWHLEGHKLKGKERLIKGTVMIDMCKTCGNVGRLQCRMLIGNYT